MPGDREPQQRKGAPRRSRRTVKMKPDTKFVTGPMDTDRRVRGGKAGRTHQFLPAGHPSRTHDKAVH